MSEQELNKWTNKLRLWMKLNPTLNPIGMKMCQICSRRGKTCLTEDNKLRLDGINIYLAGMAEAKSKADCVEWIKDV